MPKVVSQPRKFPDCSDAGGYRKIFDSSYKRGKAATFPVKQVISGWQEALQLMPVGSKYKLYIPPDLAYGPQGQGQQIGPNAVLIFDVELLDIVNGGEKEKPAE